MPKLSKKKKRAVQRPSTQAKARTTIRCGVIAQILARTRKARAEIDAFIADVELDDPDGPSQARLDPMSLHDTASIEVSEAAYERLEAIALTRHTPLEIMFDHAIAATLDKLEAGRRAAEQLHASAVQVRTKVTCTCCDGLCRNPFSWRGTSRCGCADTDVRL